MLPRCLMLLDAGNFKELKWPVSWNLISNYLLCRFISHLSVDLLGISTFFGSAAQQHFSCSSLCCYSHSKQFSFVFHCRLFSDYLKFAPLFCGTLPRRWRNKLIKKFFQIESREKLLHTHQHPSPSRQIAMKNQSFVFMIANRGAEKLYKYFIFFNFCIIKQIQSLASWIIRESEILLEGKIWEFILSTTFSIVWHLLNFPNLTFHTFTSNQTCCEKSKILQRFPHHVLLLVIDLWRQFPVANFNLLQTVSISSPLLLYNVFVWFRWQQQHNI